MKGDQLSDQFVRFTLRFTHEHPRPPINRSFSGGEFSGRPPSVRVEPRFFLLSGLSHAHDDGRSNPPERSDEKRGAR